jgi:hypothetical protein
VHEDTSCLLSALIVQRPEGKYIYIYTLVKASWRSGQTEAHWEGYFALADCGKELIMN